MSMAQGAYSMSDTQASSPRGLIPLCYSVLVKCTANCTVLGKPASRGVDATGGIHSPENVSSGADLPLPHLRLTHTAPQNRPRLTSTSYKRPGTGQWCITHYYTSLIVPPNPQPPPLGAKKRNNQSPLPCPHLKGGSLRDAIPMHRDVVQGAGFELLPLVSCAMSITGSTGRSSGGDQQTAVAKHFYSPQPGSFVHHALGVRPQHAAGASSLTEPRPLWLFPSWAPDTVLSWDDGMFVGGLETNE